jgi:uncharacterized protein YraI
MRALSARRLLATGAVLAVAGSGALLAAVPAGAATPAATPAAAHSAPAATPKAAAQPKGKVVSKVALSVRSGASTSTKRLGTVAPGAVIALQCKVVGQNVDGNRLWYRLGAGKAGYVSARYVQNLSTVQYCK